jgi:hypothetical protein
MNGMKIKSLFSGLGILFWIPVLLFFFLLILLPLRGIILRKALSSVTVRMKEHQLNVQWDGASFKGLKTVFIKGIHIQKINSENEIKVDSLRIKFRIVPLIFKSVRITKFDCRRILIKYQASSGDTIVEKHAASDSSSIFRSIMGKDLADLANKNIRRFFRYVPSGTTIGYIETSLAYAGRTTQIGMIDFKMIRGKISGMLFLSGGGSSVSIPVKGLMDKASYLTEVDLSDTSRNLLPLPFLKDKYGIEAGFDSLAVLLDFSDRERHSVNVSGEFSFSGFELSGERLATSNIKIGRFKSSFLAHLGSHSIELDSTSKVYLNTIGLIPYFRLEILEKPVVELKLLPVNWKADDFFNSLPEGMFTSLTGLKAEGDLHYFLHFFVDMSNPDSLRFATRMTSDNFRILAYGTDDYRMLNGSFYHEVYEKGKLRTAFLVGPDNPDFVAFEDISPFLRAAVMTSEDGAFFFHQGFNPEAFRESIVTNIREKRFARGGSTLTMQLVKNVFLTRNKTVARKIEEALIVWIIESQNLVSKKRMYEVYLNLIEWGPGIYGISQASRFYFNKKSRDLNLQESIYLASIVPHPKFYKYTFETNGIPRPFFGNYFRNMEELMVKKQFIGAADTNGVNPMVTLSGIAARAFAVADTVKADSLILEEMEIIPAVVKLNIRVH